MKTAEALPLVLRNLKIATTIARTIVAKAVALPVNLIVDGY